MIRAPHIFVAFAMEWNVWKVRVLNKDFEVGYEIDQEAGKYPTVKLEYARNDCIIVYLYLYRKDIITVGHTISPMLFPNLTNRRASCFPTLSMGTKNRPQSVRHCRASRRTLLLPSFHATYYYLSSSPRSKPSPIRYLNQL